MRSAVVVSISHLRRKGRWVVKTSPARLSRPAYFFAARARLGGVGKSLKLDARSLDHLLQVDDELGIHRIVGSSEGVQRGRARGVEDPEHAQLLKAAFVDTSVFLSCGHQNHLEARRRPVPVDIGSGSGSMPAFATCGGTHMAAV